METDDLEFEQFRKTTPISSIEVYSNGLMFMHKINGSVNDAAMTLADAMITDKDVRDAISLAQKLYDEYKRNNVN